MRLMHLVALVAMLTAGAHAQTKANLWTVGSDGSIHPAGRRNVTIGTTVLRPTAGSADESTAINAAITAVSGAGGGSLTLTGGTYNLARHISCASGVNIVSTANAKLRLNNQTLSALSGNAASGQKVVSVSSTSGFLAGMYVEINDSGSWENNTITSVGASSLTMTTNLAHAYTTANSARVLSVPPAIWCEGVSNVTISGLEIDGNKANNPQLTAHDSSAGNAGIYVHGSTSVNTVGNYVHDAGNHNILYEDSYYSSVRGNRSDNAARHGYDFWTSDPATVKMHITVESNSATGSGQDGIQCHQCAFVKFSGNHVSSSSSHGIKCTLANDVTYTGNTSTGNSGDGIQVDTCTRAALADNIVSDNTTFGIRLYATTASTLRGNTAHGNYTSAAHTAEIELEGTSTGNSLTANTTTFKTGGATVGIRENTAADDYNTIGLNIQAGAFTTPIVKNGANSILTANIAH